MRMLLAFYAALGLSAQTLSAQTVSTPVAGMVLDGGGRLLSVAGMAGNLLPGRTLPVALGEPIVTAAFSRSAGAIKTTSQVFLTDASGAVQSRRDAPAGAGLFAFSADGTAQWVCFPASHQLQSLSGGASMDTTAYGDSVVALGALDGKALSMLTQKGTALWAETIATETGVVSQQIAVGGQAPAVYFEGGWLTSTSQGLLWQSAVGPASSREVAIAGTVLTLQTAGAHTVAINGRWLLGADWQLLEIPFTPRNHRAERLQ